MDSMVQEDSNEMYKNQVWRIIGQTEKEMIGLDLTGKKLKELPVAKAWRNESMMTQMHYNTKPIKSNMVLSLVERTQVSEPCSSSTAYEMCDLRHLTLWKWSWYLL